MSHLAEKLQQLTPQQQTLLQLVAESATQLGFSAYLVGGIVRDLLLGHPGSDLDIVVTGNAIKLAHQLVSAHGGEAVTHKAFGTATWQPANAATIDLITARHETYAHPAALPTVTPGSLADDLARRDFSINTLAVSLAPGDFGKLHDPSNGQDDIQAGIIRALHPQSYIDDPTRIFRAVRYEQRYNFPIAPADLELIQPARAYIHQLSAERLRHELDMILAEPRAPAMLERLWQLGIFDFVVDVLPWDAGIRSRLDSALRQLPSPQWGLLPPEAGLPFQRDLLYALWLTPLSIPAIEKVHKRLNFPLAILNTLRAGSSLLAESPPPTGIKPSAWVERLEHVPPLAIYTVSVLSPNHAGPLWQYATQWRHMHIATTGDTLKALGLRPGPAYQKILKHLRAALLDGEIYTREEEKALLQSLIPRYT